MLVEKKHILIVRDEDEVEVLRVTKDDKGQVLDLCFYPQWKATPFSVCLEEWYQMVMAVVKVLEDVALPPKGYIPKEP